MSENPINERQTKIWLWVGLIFFSSGIFILDLNNNAMREGILWGLATILILIVFVYFQARRQLPKNEVKKNRKTFNLLNKWPFILLFILLAFILRGVLQQTNLLEHFLGFGVVFMIGATMSALYIAYTKRGLFQKT